MTSCDPTAVLDRVWEFGSNGTYFYLILHADGTYRRETDTPPASVTCEHGEWSVSECGVIDFHTCRDDVERRAWTTSPTTFTLDQTVYRESQLSEGTAFIFCDVDACD